MTDVVLLRAPVSTMVSPAWTVEGTVSATELALAVTGPQQTSPISFVDQATATATFWVLAVVPPLVFTFAKPDVFLKALDIAGTYGAGIFAGIMPALMVLRVRKEQLGRALTARERMGPYAVLVLFVFVLLYATVSFLF